MKKIRVACVQMNAGSDFELNFAKSYKYFLKAVRSNANWIAFPENFIWRGSSRNLSLAAKRSPEVILFFKIQAKKYKVSILLGSLLEKARRNFFYNTSILINDQGRVAGRYRKIHLFDVDIPGARCLESRHVQAGNKVVSSCLNGIRTGLSICYDLRFPELFRSLTKRGSCVLFVPSNFTETTGKAHWEVLLKARAVENLSFVIAPGQVGVHPETKIKSFGTSLIIDPWGRVLAKGSLSKEQVITADLDFQSQSKIRKNFPVLSHIRL